MLDIDMATSPVAAAFEVVLHTLISRSIQTMRKSTMPRSALAEPLRYAQSARLGRVPMGCGPAYAAVTPPGGNLDPARHFPPQRAKLPDEVSGVQHRDNRVRSTEKPPPAMSLTEARRNQSSVSARSVIVLSRIRRTLVCLARRNAASSRGALPLNHDVPNRVQAGCKTPDAEDNPRGSSTVFYRHCCTPARQPYSRDGREIGCPRPMERRQ